MVADWCGTERGVDWVGGSVTVGLGGYPATGPVGADRTAALTAAIDLLLARDKRSSERNDLFADRRSHLYGRLWDIAYPAEAAADYCATSASPKSESAGQRLAEAFGLNFRQNSDPNAAAELMPWRKDDDLQQPEPGPSLDSAQWCAVG